MDAEKLVPVSVESVGIEDLRHVFVLGKIDKDERKADFVKKTDGMLDVASNALNLIDRANLYKVEVPEGYTLKNLVSSAKDKKAVRALVKDSRGKFNGDVSLKPGGVGVAQIASMGLAAAAMVVGQAYMTEISDSLQRIDEKLDAVIAMIASEKRATVKNAISIANTYSTLYDEYRSKPQEAFQAARIEIESRYNDVGEVIDWIVEQLPEFEKRAIKTRSTEKKVSLLLDELLSYEEQFLLCLQALSALAMTRMYYDGCLDREGAIMEKRRIASKSREFLSEHQRLIGILEFKIGSLKGAPVALPRDGDGKNDLRLLVSQTPRAAARKQLLSMKTRMQTKLRKATEELESSSGNCVASIDRISSACQSARTMLTDGNDFWIIEEELEG